MLLDGLLLFLIIIILSTIFSCAGTLFIDERNTEKNFLNPISIGFSAFIIFLYFFYFIFRMDLKTTAILTILILLILSFISLKKNFIYNLKLILENIFIILPSTIFFLIICIKYGENFFVFRGNHWDYFYYLSQAILVNKYDYATLLELNSNSLNLDDTSSNFKPYYFDANFENIFYHNERPTIFLIFGAMLLFPFKNIFFVSYIFKIFLSSLAGCTINYILRFIRGKKISNIFISIVFTISFWIVYIHEIDALVQIASLAIFIPLTFSSIILYQDKLFDNNNIIYSIGLLFISLYIFYIDLFIVCTFFYLIVFILNIKKSINFVSINRKNILLLTLFLILIIFLSFDNIFYPVYETRIARLENTNFITLYKSQFLWGYYGSFILGKDSIITNPQIISNLLNLGEINTFDLIKKIFSYQYANGFKYFFLNILPSASGLYFFGLPRIHDSNFILLLIMNLFINFYIFKVLYLNIRSFKTNGHYLNIFFKNFIIFFILISSIFIFLGQLFVVIKIYFAFSFVIFLYLSINFSAKLKPNIVFLVLISFFIFYKFSSNNFGIGRYDSFPSIINKNYKTNFNWTIKMNLAENCNNIKNEIKNYDTEKLQWIKYNYVNIKLYKYHLNKNSSFKCKIIDSNNSLSLLKQ